MGPKINLFDILESISFTKEDLSSHQMFEKEYNPFMVNRYLAMHNDTIFVAEIMSKCYNLPKKIQYKIYMDIIDKKKRFFKYPKKMSRNDLDSIKEYFNVNHEKAEELYELLTPEMINNINEALRTGRE